MAVSLTHRKQSALARLRRDGQVERFEKWRRETDEDCLLDTFDLALGWFSALGFDHDSALDVAQRLTAELDR